MNITDDPRVDQRSFSLRDLYSIDQWDEFTVSTNVTTVGALSTQGRYRIVGRSCQFQATLSATTSVTAAAGSSFLKLPIDAVGLSGFAAMTMETSSVGLCAISVSTSRCYLPTQAATANPLKVYGTFEIGD